MTDERCYRNQTRSGKTQLADVTSGQSVCPGTESSSGFSRCCGASDICLPNNICQALNPPANGTGYSVGSCTDRDYADDSICSSFCSQLATSEITYDADKEKWFCCGKDKDGNLDCKNPTTRASAAPGPKELLASYSASTSTVTGTASPTVTVSVTPNPMPNDGENDGGLSTGAKAGIGVGAGLGALVLLALIFVLFQRSTLKSNKAHRKGFDAGSQNGQQPLMHKQQDPGALPPAYGQVKQDKSSAKYPTQPPVELSPQNQRRPVELPATPIPSELPARGAA